MGTKATMAGGGASQAGGSEFDEHRLRCRWVAARLQFSLWSNTSLCRP